jgi:hypothetical protein
MNIKLKVYFINRTYIYSVLNMTLKDKLEFFYNLKVKQILILNNLK